MQMEGMYESDSIDYGSQFLLSKRHVNTVLFAVESSWLVCVVFYYGTRKEKKSC
jgi:hypothetical protein